MNQGHPFDSTRWQGMGLVLVSGICWGFHGVLIKIAFGLGMSFVQVFFFEVLFAAIFFGLFARGFFDPVRPSGLLQWAMLLCIGCSTIGVGFFLFLSYSLGPVAIAATLMFLYLPVVYAISVLRKQQSLSLVKCIAIALILLGAVLTTDLINNLSDPGVSGAVFAALGAALSYAVVFALTPQVSTFTTLHFRSFTVSFVGLLGCSVILILWPSFWYDLSGNAVQVVLYALVLGVIGQTLPVITLMKGLPLTGGSLGGVLASVELPIAIISAAIVLGEPFHLWKIPGVLLVLGGIVIYNFAERFAPSKPAPNLAN